MFSSHREAINAFISSPDDQLAVVPNKKWADEINRRLVLKSPSKTILGARVFTLVEYLKQHAPFISPVITYSTKRALAYHILKHAKLSYFKKISPGVVNTFLDAIDRLKKNRILPQELAGILSTRGSEKESDLLKVYGTYEAELKNRKWFDEGNLYNLPVEAKCPPPMLVGFVSRPNVPFEAEYLEITPESVSSPSVFALNSPLDEACFIAEKIAGSRGNVVVYLPGDNRLAWEILNRFGNFLPFNVSSSNIVREIFNSRFPETGTPEEYASAAKDILRESYQTIRTDEISELSARTLSCFDFVLRALEKILFENRDYGEEIPKDEFLAVLHQHMGAGPALPENLPFKFASWEDAGLYEQDIAIIPSLNDGNMPATEERSIFFAEPDMFSPAPDRRIEKIFPNQEMIVKNAARLLNVAASTNSILTFHSHAINGSDAAPLPFLLKWPIETVVSPPPSHEPQNDTCGTNFMTPSALEELKKFMAGKPHFSPTKLEEYGNCPFTYFCRHILEIEPTDEITPEVQPRDVGTLTHEILEVFFATHGKIYNNSLDVGDKLNNLPLIVSEIAEAVFERRSDITKKYHAEMVNHLKKRTILQVVAVIENELAFMSGAPQRPSRFELAFDDILKDDIRIRGKIDRIDEDETSFTVIDYKTGGVEAVRSGIEEGTELQIPIYTEMARRVLGKEPSAAYLYSVKKQHRESGVIRKDFRAHVSKKPSRMAVAEDEWNSLMELGIETACKYARNIRRGIFEKSPHKCPSYCDWKDACRYESD